MARKEKKGISYNEALEKLQRGNTARTYLLHGEEPYLAEKLRKAIILKTLGSDKDDFNLHVFYGKEIVMESLLTALTSYPVMAERKVVVLKETDILRKDDKEILARYIEQLDETACLIVMADKPDFRQKLFQYILKEGVTVQLDKLNESEMPELIRNGLNEYGKQISDSAAFMMASRLNLSLQELDVEIEKLVSFAGDRKTISDEDVEAVTGISRQYNTFELCQRIGNKDYAGSLTILRQLLLRGEEPAGMIALVFRQYNILWQIAESLEQRVPGTDIEQMIFNRFRIPPFIVKTEYIRQAKKYDIVHLRRSFDYILQADRDIKSISVKPGLIMEKMFYLLIYGYPR